MQPKKIALISDAWVPQVNGVVTTFQSVIPLLEKKGFEIKILGLLVKLIVSSL